MKTSKIIFVLFLLSYTFCFSQTPFDTTSRDNKVLSEIHKLDNRLYAIENKIKSNSFFQIFLPVFLAFLSAMAITYIGAYTAKRNEYKKSIFLRRLDIFDKFLNELDIFYSKCVVLVLETNQFRKSNNNQPDPEIPYKVSNIFIPVKLKSTSIYLLLNKNDKDIFSEHVDTIRKNIVSSCIDVSVYKFNIDQDIETIKQILNNNLQEVTI
jgi:hypothetical protein